jgi:hypothetical protein
VTAIVHATGIVTMTAILGLVVRGVAAHTRAVLRELNILLVIILTGRKRLTAPTSLAMIRELTGAGHAPAAGKIQRAAGTQKPAGPNPVKQSPVRLSVGEYREPGLNSQRR